MRLLILSEHLTVSLQPLFSLPFYNGVKGMIITCLNLGSTLWNLFLNCSWLIERFSLWTLYVLWVLSSKSPVNYTTINSLSRGYIWIVLFRVRPALTHQVRGCMVSPLHMLTIEHVAYCGALFGRIRFSSGPQLHLLLSSSPIAKQLIFWMKPSTYFERKPVNSPTIW